MSLKEQSRHIVRLDNWKCHDWEQVHLTDQRSVFWQARDVDEPDYESRVGKIVSVATEAIHTVAQLFDTQDYYIEVALFPHTNFRDDLGLTRTIPYWVQLCVRDKRVCFDVGLAKNWKRNLASLPPDNKRETIHEVGHRVVPQFSSFDELAPLYIREGAVETIARVLAGIQAELPENTRYITTNLRDELVSPVDIDRQGIFHFSSERPSLNPAMMSCFVYTLGVALDLSGNIKEGLIALRDLAINSQGINQFSGNLQETLTQSDPRRLQFTGIDYIGDNFATGSK